MCKSVIAILMTLLVTLGSLVPQPGDASVPMARMGPAPVDMESGLRFELRDGSGVESAPESLPQAATQPLSAARTQALLQRVALLEPDGDEQQEFALREASTPPPRAGVTVEAPWPPSTDGDAPALPEAETEGELRVLRHAPDGEVALAPHFSISFSQPMLAVTDQEQASATVPVRLDPQPPGQWRWLGTRTLMFQPDGRFPMATEYTATVPAGTVSALGSRLAEDYVLRFATPPPSLVRMEPTGGPHDLEPAILLAFDQKVDGKDVLAHTRLRSGDAQDLELRPLDPLSLPEDHWLRRASEGLIEGRWVALRPAQPLPRATSFNVEVAAGLPSQEGPRRSREPSNWSFSTYAPLVVKSWHCGWRGGQAQREDCDPEGSWYVEFNNPLDPEAFDPQSVNVTPAVEGLQVQANGNGLSLHGAFVGRTAYQLSLPATLRDRFGQTLGKPTVLKFSTGNASPRLFGPGKEMITLDPMAPPALSVFSRNVPGLEVDIHRVGPEHWAEMQEWARTSRYDNQRNVAMPGKRVAKRVLQVESRDDSLIETRIALDKYLDDGLGQLLLRVRPSPLSEELRWQEVLVWVQSTRIGLVAVNDESRVTVWSSDLRDGSALNDVDVGLHDHAATSRSGEDGLAQLDLPVSGDHRLLLARRGKDLALLPRHANWHWSPAWLASPQSNALNWLVFDDRGMYRPGEQVRIKGWLRLLDRAPRGDLQLLKPAPAAIAWKLTDSQGVELASGSTPMSALGGFDVAIDLPATPNLGQAQLSLQANGVSGVEQTETWHHFQIQEFRRPEYEVTASAEPGPFVIGDSANLSVAASYYAGGGLGSAPVEWQVSASPTRYVPPDRSDWSFGSWTPWWRPLQVSSPGNTQSLSGRTDPLGQHHLQARFLEVDPPRPTQLQAQATVTDVNRQAWSAQTSLLVHPSAHYVGLQMARSVVPRGRPVDVRALAVDIDGTAISESDLDLVMTRLVWGQVKGQWQEIDSEPESCRRNQRGGEPVECSFRPNLGGQYRIEATVRDAQGRPNVSELRFWVPGGEGRPARDVELETLVLVPDREAPLPGETVQVLVQAPFASGEGLMTLSRGGVLEQRRFALQDGGATLSFTVDDGMVPGVRLDVAVVGKAPRSDDAGKPVDSAPPRPAAASGGLDFRVPPVARSLNVTAKPRAAVLEPGASTVIEVQVTDADGQPVKDAELALVVADESVLALSGYRMPDPLEVFYAARPSRVSSTFGHPQVVLADQRSLASGSTQSGDSRLDSVEVTGSRVMRMEMAPPPPPMAPAPADSYAMAPPVVFDGSTDETSTIALRSDFSALALFAPEVRTDAKGRAEVPLDLPDSLTRYRVMAVAVAGARQFGSGESSITARQPLMLRPSPPRFANFGDRFELPIVLQNQTDAPMQVDVALRALNADFIDSLQDAPAEPGKATTLNTTGRRLTVPAQQRVELRIPTSTLQAGRAHFQVVASAGADSDAQSFEFPIWTPATREAFATYGSLAETSLALQPVLAPQTAWPQFGGLSVTASSTELQSLTDALIYLVDYPFQCNEQRASRVLAIAALRDVLTAFDAPGLPKPELLEASVRSDLEHLATLQHANGGWSFWGRNDQAWPYLGIHVAHAFARADAKGFAMPDAVRQRSLAYLRNIESHLPHWYNADSGRVLRAYAMEVRRQLGDADIKKAQALLAEVSSPAQLTIETIGWLLPTLQAGKDEVGVETLLRHLGNRISETAAAAHFVSSMSEQGGHVLLHSDRRGDGVVLEALLQVRPQHDLIEKLVRGVLGHRVQGRWGNTQENAFILLALDGYFHAREGVTPDFVARVWLDRGLVGEHAFKGRSTERFAARVPMAELLRVEGPRDLLLQKDGAGRMYYRIGLDYAPRDLKLSAADHGFAVERRYEAVDDPADVRRDADGSWHIRAGAKVRVNLTMVATGRRLHVALVDPLPAGMEAINPALAVSEHVPADPGKVEPYWWWHRPWYEHQNLRDERVEAFASLLWEGVHTYSYVARATTPGHFVVPPPHAEEMYHPETFGRGGTDRVVIE